VDHILTTTRRRSANLRDESAVRRDRDGVNGWMRPRNFPHQLSCRNVPKTNRSPGRKQRLAIGWVSQWTRPARVSKAHGSQTCEGAGWQGVSILVGGDLVSRNWIGSIICRWRWSNWLLAWWGRRILRDLLAKNETSSDCKQCGNTQYRGLSKANLDHRFIRWPCTKEPRGCLPPNAAF